jgi:hypothetical protein
VGAFPRFYRSDAEWNAIVLAFKLTPCPHCKVVGALNCHGFLRGFDDSSPQRQTIRAHRIFCSNRHRRLGCGRTFSVWLFDKIRRLGLSAPRFWQFLQRVVASTLAAAIDATPCPYCRRTMQRIWRRFRLGQSRIRTAIRPPPSTPVSKRPETEVLDHLQAAFPDHNPIAQFQWNTNAFFI